MLPLKKILCPTDFSDPSFEALDAASEMAGHFSGELIVVHVVPPIPVMATGHMSPAAFNVHEYQEEMEKSSKNELDQYIAEKVPESVSARGMVLVGNPGDQIVDTAEDEDVDIIVIATHGQTGLKRVVFGSVAEKVVRHAKQPVLTVRAGRS